MLVQFDKSRKTAAHSGGPILSIFLPRSEIAKLEDASLRVNFSSEDVRSPSVLFQRFQIVGAFSVPPTLRQS